jgi:low affinity Fe/Cu permease
MTISRSLAAIRVSSPNPADERGWSSRQLHRINHASGSSAATGLAAGLSLAFLTAAFAGHRETHWLTIFQSTAAAITLVMVFALQHTQVRTQAAMQRKLDEILSALPAADSRLVHVETASQTELDALDARHGQVREDALDSSAEPA